MRKRTNLITQIYWTLHASVRFNFLRLNKVDVISKKNGIAFL